MLILPSCKVVDLSVAGTAEAQKIGKQDLGIGRRRKQVASSSDPESVGLHGCSIVDHQNGASKKSELCLEEEKLSSSCGSVPIKTSLAGLPAPSQKIKLNAASSKENVGVNSIIAAEKPKYSNNKYKDSCSLKVILILF